MISQKENLPAVIIPLVCRIYLTYNTQGMNILYTTPVNTVYNFHGILVVFLFYKAINFFKFDPKFLFVQYIHQLSQIMNSVTYTNMLVKTLCYCLGRFKNLTFYNFENFIQMKLMTHKIIQSRTGYQCLYVMNTIQKIGLAVAVQL